MATVIVIYNLTKSHLFILHNTETALVSINGKHVRPTCGRVIPKTIITRKAPRMGANSSSVFAFDMHYK